jgi:hypothetical protein
MVDNKVKTEIEPELQTQPAILKRKFTPLAIVVSVFVIALSLYLYTLAPTVTLVDSGELILAARSLGVAHPPGFPLYLLLAHLFSLLPFGNLAVRIHVFSAVCASIASALMALTVLCLLQIPHQAKSRLSLPHTHKRKGKTSTKGQDIEPTQSSSPVFMLAPAILSGLLLTFSRTLWAYATIAEVYTLNALLLIVISYLMISWRRDVIKSRIGQTEFNDRKLLLAAFVFGLALGVHHVTIGLLLPGLAALVFVTEGISFFKSRRLLITALVSITGLFVYLYLPIAASRSPLMNWGSPNTLEQFWWHVTGKQYQVFFDLSFSRISQFFKLVFREFSPSWFPLTLLISFSGFIYLYKRDKAIFFYLLLTVLADVFYCMGYEIDEDKDAYYLPTFIALVVAFGCGIRWLLEGIQAWRFKTVVTPIRAAIIFILIPVIALAANFPYNNRSHYFIARDYVENTLSTIQPKGLLLTDDWQVYSPMLYVRLLEHQREDVLAIDINQLRRWWYFDYLKQVYPDLINNSRDKVDAFLEDLINWEHHPDLYAKDVTLNKRINNRFYEMIQSFITNQIDSGPVYVTQNLALRQQGQDAELSKWLLEKYQIIPQGLVFRVAKDASVADRDKPQFKLRGLTDGTLKFEDDDVVKKKVLPVYLSMFINNGRFLAIQNQHDKAVEWFRDALSLDPGNQAAKNFLTASQNALQKPAVSK